MKKIAFVIGLLLIFFILYFSLPLTKLSGFFVQYNLTPSWIEITNAKYCAPWFSIDIKKHGEARIGGIKLQVTYANGSTKTFDLCYGRGMPTKLARAYICEKGEKANWTLPPHPGWLTIPLEPNFEKIKLLTDSPQIFAEINFTQVLVIC
jgi:hypothetical protein